MSDRKSARRIATVGKRLGKLPQTVTKSVVTRLLRLAFMMNRRSRLSATGFVLPTVVLLILVVTLTTGALVFRAFNSSTNTIANNQNRVIQNAATPAIDRARAKLEYLFDASKDSRLPSGVPSEQYLTSMMLNDDSTVKGATAPKLLKGGSDPVLNDPYTLPGKSAAFNESRIDINGDGKNDNAWSYKADTDGDGTEDATVAYSIIFSTPLDEASPPSGQQPIKGTQKLVSLSDAAKVAGESAIPGERKISYARSGPISNAAGLSCGTGGGSRDGWYADRSSSSTLRKNFQIDAIVIPHKGSGGVTTLELQQDRQLDSGNKWGAWFRTDMETNAGGGSPFQWNGAMHTEGSLLIGGNFEAHLISSPASCLYEAKASEISVGKTGSSGLILASSSATGAINGTSAPIYIHSNSTTPPSTNLTLNTDWVGSALPTPGQMLLKADKLLTEDVNVAVGGGGDNSTYKDATKYDQRALTSPDGFGGRFTATSELPPYVDDFYRADNRYGPKPKYDNQISIPSGTQVGAPISNSDSFLGGKTGANLTLLEPPTGGGSDNVGLDGYWERRARYEGLRVLVGERLELGNAFGWGGSSATPTITAIPAVKDPSITMEPLYPPVNPKDPAGLPETDQFSVRHEIQQNRALRDNLSAVQASAVYHAAGSMANKDIPLACLATTTHPGTPQTLANTINFRPTAFAASTSTGATGKLLTDFFNGRGTNGWEFAAPTETDVSTTSSKLRTVLNNLAQFAGDDISDTRTGAYPPTQEANIPHPYPLFTMWGNFSNLRRALRKLESGTTYANLSPADKSYLYTAGCTVGMLAYNMNEVLNFDFNASSNKDALTRVADLIIALVNANPSTYATAPVEAVLANIPATTPQEIADLAIAKTLATRAQIVRDRAYGFQRTRTDTATIGAAPPFKVARLTGIGAPAGIHGFSQDRNFLDTLSPDRKAALLKLYGTYVKEDTTTGADEGIQPKWPALYYLFPLNTHTHADTGATAQPDAEPYIDDAYVITANPSSLTYTAVDPEDVDLLPKSAAGFTSTAGSWIIPYSTTINTGTRYENTNIIIAPDNTRAAIGFLDRVLYNSRERLPARVLDIDLGLLRRTAIGTDAWLPKSGIVYAFREDATREDGISRPAGATLISAGGRTTALNVRITTADNPFGGQTDPPLATRGISAKAVDYVPDPSRRVHGFRLRDGSRLRRLTAVADEDNTKGISMVTDNPLYVMGDFNLHELKDSETALEEFSGADRLWNFTTADNTYTPDRFYGRKQVDTRFAAATQDEWRPAELLSDALTIISADFCDGSNIDTFWNPGELEPTLTSARRKLYHQPNTTAATAGLYGPGCDTSGVGDRTSFLNQNRPKLANVVAPTDNSVTSWGPILTAVGGTTRTWLRENPYDATSPVRISRNGLPLTVKSGSTPTNQAGLPPLVHTVDQTTVAAPYDRTAYQDIIADETRPKQKPTTGQRVNAIVVSGLVPSRDSQYNGGMHNFPRFIENWDTIPLWFSGSLLQLSFSNYATAPFDSSAWEPSDDQTTMAERATYYNPPKRFWGYDVALQLAPSSPAAARFVTPSATRSEFYTELPVSDAYIKALCTNAPTPTGVRKPC